MTGPRLAVVAAVLLAGSACSSGDSPARQAEGQQAGSATAEKTVAPAPAKTTAAAPTPPPVAVAAAPKGRRRCGWLVNPTPANWWLSDRDGQWVLATQGADQAPGMDEMPDMSTAGWVETNGHYGYGCACMTITADVDGQVIRIADAAPKPLKQCKADRSLPPPD